MKSSIVRLGVIGYGYWGPNLVRNFLALDESNVTIVADRDASKLKKLAKMFPSVRGVTDARELIESPEVDAVAIATPVSSHYPLAKAALEAGKHVFVEKPIASSSDEARELISLARKESLALMVDHTFLYTGAVKKIRELIDAGDLGDLYYLDSERINLGLLHEDVNVLWDLAAHDISILLYLIKEKPAAVQAIGYKHIGQQEEMAELNLRYQSGFHAHIRVSWLSPVKVRVMMIGGSRKMIVYNDIEPSDKIRVYDKGIVLNLDEEDVTTSKPIYRAGDVFIPELDRTEALQNEAVHFLDCIRTGKPPMSGGPEGLAVVRVLEAAARSLAIHGDFVPLESEGDAP